MPEIAAPLPIAGLDGTLRWFGGGFRQPTLETAFEHDRQSESLRHARYVLIAALGLNLLFLVSDWRFWGTPHFWVALPARLAVIAIAATHLLAVRRPASVERVQATLISWMLLTAPPVAVLVTSGSVIALAVSFVLPTIYYLCAPVRFAWLVRSTSFTSAAMLAGLIVGGLPTGQLIGVSLTLLMLNVALMLSVTRSNRLHRINWLAARTEAALRSALDSSRATLERMFDACPVPLVLTDAADGSMIRMSDSCGALIGPAAPTTLLRLGGAPDDSDALARALAEGGGEAEYETVVDTPTLGTRTLLVKAAALDLNDRPVVLAGLLDITRRKAEQTSLERLASTDALTGLRNRLSFFAIARTEMLRAARTRAPLALMMIDIDHFKRINDTLGHLTGDIALRAFANLCTERLGVGATVGRLGGEEFAVLMPQASAATAGRVAEDLRAAAAALHVPTGAAAPLRLTVSIGVAEVAAGDRDIDAALARADLALYAAKRGGRDRVVVDDPDDAARLRA